MPSSKTEKEKKLRRDNLALTAAVLAKRANTRLRALEQRGLQEGSNAYRFIEKLHFDKDSAMSVDSKGRMKFNTNFRGLSYQDIQHRIREINRFLKARTSKVSGVNSMYKKGFETYRERYNAKISYSEFSDLMRNDTMKRLISRLSSSTISRVITHMNETEETVDQAMDRFRNVDIENSDITEFEEVLNEDTPWGENVTEKEDITNVWKK